MQKLNSRSLTRHIYYVPDIVIFVNIMAMLLDSVLNFLLPAPLAS